VIGHSAGGHLVLVLSADEGTPLQSVVALAPVADLELAYERELDGDAVAAFLGRTPDQRADLDPSRRGPSMIPVAIVHGDDDSLVPLEVTQSYLDRLPADQRPRLVTLPNTGHFELIDPAAPAMSAVLAALDELAAMRFDIG
jgi:pimeloyl-ACP methyl ester carboxylesterase